MISESAIKAEGYSPIKVVKERSVLLTSSDIEFEPQKSLKAVIVRENEGETEPAKPKTVMFDLVGSRGYKLGKQVLFVAVYVRRGWPWKYIIGTILVLLILAIIGMCILKKRRADDGDEEDGGAEEGVDLEAIRANKNKGTASAISKA